MENLRKYKIIRFRRNASPRRERGYNLMTIEEARSLCSQEDTHRKKGDDKDWFLGFTAV